MNSGARIESVEVLKALRQALCTFQLAAQGALGAAVREVRRSRDELQGRLEYWRREVQRREEEVARARNELAQKRWGKTAGQEVSTVDQEIALRKAQNRL